jgi:integrase
MRAKLTQAFAESAAAELGAERTVYWDAGLAGFGLMVTSAGAKSFVVQYRADGRSRRMTLKSVLSVEQARREARKILGKVASGHDPLGESRKKAEATKNSLRSIVEEYQRREGRKLRTGKWRMDALEKHALPPLGAKQIGEIKRSDIVRLLDYIEDNSGPVMADRVLGILSRIFNWHAGRSDDFRSPIIRGMARTSNSERARDRILSDDEIRAVWRATEAPTGPFPALVRFLLLTAARRSEAAEMRWSELSGKDWILPGGRNKTGLELVRPLSDEAMTALAGLPKIGKGEFVFSTGRGRAFTDYDHGKKQFDAACGVTGWTLHDLRRTARSLMSRAGVPSDHAERCLGHVIGGVRGTYDRHEYHEEKRRAFEALAAQIEHIVNPQENVVLIGRSAS